MVLGIKNFESIKQNTRDYMLIVYDSGVREVYDITGKTNVIDPETAKKYGSFVGRDFNGNHPNPPPLIPSDTSPNMCPSCKIIDKKLKDIQEREEELSRREEELEKNWEEIRKKTKQ